MNDYLSRIGADSRDRVAFARFRDRKIGGSDAAGFSKFESAPKYARDKVYNPFEGNSYTRHGNDREALMLSAMHVPANPYTFYSRSNPRHIATPDGIRVGGDGSLVLAECKTTNHEFRTIPLRYFRQVWWTQYVLDAEKTLFVWEVHDQYKPLRMEPESVVIERNDDEITKMIRIADEVLRIIDSGDAFKREMENRRNV